MLFKVAWVRCCRRAKGEREDGVGSTGARNHAEWAGDWARGLRGAELNTSKLERDTEVTHEPPEASE